mgnify:CR=1 FL=1
MIAIVLKTKTKYGNPRRKPNDWSFFQNERTKVVTIKRDNVIISIINKKSVVSDNDAFRLLMSEIKRYDDIPLYERNKISYVLNK